MAERSPGLWDGPSDDADEPATDPENGTGTGHEGASDAALGVAARHALHDEELIAAFAGGDLEAGPEADRAAALVARCATCADLHRDIAAIETAVRAVGTAAAVGARVTAPRDFRLTLEVAAGLRPGAWLRPATAAARQGSFIDRLAASIAGFGRPLGASLATLGIVGLLVGSAGFGAGTLSPAGAGGPPKATEDTTFVTAPGPGGPMESSRNLASATTATDGTEVNPEVEPGDLADGGSAATWVVGASVMLLALGITLILIATRGSRRHAATAG